MVLAAVVANGGVEFHRRWGWDWTKDNSSKWKVRPSTSQLSFWDASTQRDLCLDAYEAWNGGVVHLWTCDPWNGNQKWAFDRATMQTHKGVCLDMIYAQGGVPHLWQCLDVELQKFEW